MANTTNYNWETPDDTDLVKDGAAAIRTLGSSIDTTTKNLNPETTTGDISYRSATANVNTRLALGTAGQVLKVNSGATAPEWATDVSGMTNPMTTTADIIYSSSGSTPARLGIGTAGQVLKVNSGATAPEWGAAGASATSYALLNAGGTSLSGAATTTISSLSGYNKMMVLITGASSENASASMDIRFNADSGSNYFYMQGYATPLSSYAGGVVDNTANTTGTSFPIGQMSDMAASNMSGYLLIDGANSSGIKVFNYATGATPRPSGFTNRFISGGGNYSGTSVISSISFISSTGAWDAGTVYVYGAN